MMEVNMNKEQLLIYKLGKLQNKYWYDAVLAFIKYGSNDGLNFYELKPLFDEFGYQETINAMLEIDRMENNEKHND